MPYSVARLYNLDRSFASLSRVGRQNGSNRTGTCWIGCGYGLRFVSVNSSYDDPSYSDVLPRTILFWSSRIVSCPYPSAFVQFFVSPLWRTLTVLGGLPWMGPWRMITFFVTTWLLLMSDRAPTLRASLLNAVFFVRNTSGLLIRLLLVHVRSTGTLICQPYFIAHFSVAVPLLFVTLSHFLCRPFW